ncbi:LysE family translocator [Aquimarina agarivorans]|uniref:LysE family translocator n=1 Tax=Aquimarina agarivorans TaxID=980584 RepID=UPI000248EDD8|nr:LysE family transporter [Aquimarina agarivorans]
MITTKLFVITFFAAFVGVIPPGLVNMTVAKTCLERGKRSGILVAFGASVVVLLQALIAIQLARYIFDDRWMYHMILRTGVVVFLLLGIYFFIKAKKRASQKKVKLSQHGALRSFFKGAMISAFNILPIPYFCMVGAALNLKGTVEYDLPTIYSFILAASTGTFVMLYIYAISFLKIQIKEERFAQKSNYFMAMLMGILMVVTVIRILAE